MLRFPDLPAGRAASPEAAAAARAQQQGAAPPMLGRAGKEADQHDAALASILARLAEHRRRRTLLLAFAQSPVDFIHAMAAAQARELRSSSARDGEAYELMA
ncbi:hypothetical protein COHA_010854, partial [Chlorella ohadii]